MTYKINNPKKKDNPDLRTKREIIYSIERLDAEKGHFYPEGNYRYGVKFYYGKLEKYPKYKLIQIENNMKEN